MIHPTTNMLSIAVNPYIAVNEMYAHVSMLQCSKPFLFILGSYLAIEKLKHCRSIVNKTTGQVCRPAEKKTAVKKTKQHKSKWNRLLPTQDMYLQFIRSNMGVLVLCWPG